MDWPKICFFFFTNAFKSNTSMHLWPHHTTQVSKWCVEGEDIHLPDENRLNIATKAYFFFFLLEDLNER